MKDYIDILLNELWEHWAEFLSRDYYLEKARQGYAEKALLETLSKEQADLFLTYEEHINEVSVLHEACMVRQAFLLAKEIYR